MDVNEFIDETIKVIESRGWHQGFLWGESGAVCVYGAAYVVNDRLIENDDTVEMSGRSDGDTKVMDDAMVLVRSQIADQYGVPYHIPYFNDEVAKSVEDVLLVLKKSKTE